jgi:hypothetical protein
MQDAYAWSTSPEATVSFEQSEDELGHGKRNLMSGRVMCDSRPPADLRHRAGKHLDSPLGELLLPRHRAQMAGDMARVTLRQLLTMSAGFENDDATASPFADAIRQDDGAVAFILKRGLVSSPGETFAYSNSSAHLVSAVLTLAGCGSDPPTCSSSASSTLTTAGGRANSWFPKNGLQPRSRQARQQPVRVDVVVGNDPQRRFGVLGGGIRRSADRYRSGAPARRRSRLPTHQGLRH